MPKILFLPNGCKINICNDKLVKNLKIVKKFFSKNYSSYILCLIGDKERLNNDLSNNGININPTDIYHLVRNTEDVVFWNSLPRKIRRSINFINKFIPNNGNRKSTGCAGIYLYNFLIDTFKIPTLYLGKHTLGIIKRNLKNDLYFKAYGQNIRDNTIFRFFWKVDCFGYKFPIFTNTSEECQLGTVQCPSSCTDCSGQWIGGCCENPTSVNDNTCMAISFTPSPSTMSGGGSGGTKGKCVGGGGIG